MPKHPIGAKIDPALHDDLVVLSAYLNTSKSHLVEEALRLLFERNPVDDLMRARVAQDAKERRAKRRGLGLE